MDVRQSTHTKVVMTNSYSNGREEGVNGHKIVMETSPNRSPTGPTNAQKSIHLLICKKTNCKHPKN